mgnify:CR=1 FL=1
MLSALTQLLIFQLTGEIIARGLNLPVPGPVIGLALLLPALPLFAYAEERMFRAGAQRWARGRRTLKVLQFGMIHVIIGIPIGAALALSIGGASSKKARALATMLAPLAAVSAA